MKHEQELEIVFIGLSLTSSWGNGHAVTYRGLIPALSRRGHRVVFLEHDRPWYAANRDLDRPEYCRVGLYGSVAELKEKYKDLVRDADLVVVGSYVAEGLSVCAWVLETARGMKAFYDIDTPVTMAALAEGRCTYIDAGLIGRFDLYLSFTGGPFLAEIQDRYNIPSVYALYCSADPEHYRPENVAPRHDLGYMGTYSPDRQPGLERLMLSAARRRPEARFVVAGPQYPDTIAWPPNVTRIEHLAPRAHREFYNAQRFTLNLTRADMVHAGWSPSVRLFEAAACGTAIISDAWPGLETFLTPGEEILISRGPEQTLQYLDEVSDARRRAIGRRARRRILDHHTADHRAAELARLVAELRP